MKRTFLGLTVLLLTACGTTATRIDIADTCEGKLARSQCWMELESHPGCYVWNAFLLDGMTASWDGSCSGQLADVTGTGKSPLNGNLSCPVSKSCDRSVSAGTGGEHAHSRGLLDDQRAP